MAGFVGPEARDAALSTGSSCELRNIIPWTSMRIPFSRRDQEKLRLPAVASVAN